MSEEIAMSAYKKAKTADVKADANAANIAALTQDVNAHKAEDVTQGNPHGIDAKANKAQENWKTLTLINGWTVDTYAVRFFKDDFGFVHLQGRLKGGTDDVIGVLPVGYRPSYEVRLPHGSYKLSNFTTGMLSIDSNGNIAIRNKGTYSYLDGVSFQGVQ